MANVKFNEYEMKVIRFLANRFHNGGSYFTLEGCPDFDQVGRDCVEKVVCRLENYGWIASESTTSWTIQPSICDVVDRLDNPEAKDYWRWLTTWFRSKWWSLPVILLVVGIPLIWKWVEMLTAVLRYCVSGN